MAGAGARRRLSGTHPRGAAEGAARGWGAAKWTADRARRLAAQRQARPPAAVSAAPSGGPRRGEGRVAALLPCLLGCRVWKAVTTTLRGPGTGALGGCAGEPGGRRAFVGVTGLPRRWGGSALRSGGGGRRGTWRPKDGGGGAGGTSFAAWGSAFACTAGPSLYAVTWTRGSISPSTLATGAAPGRGARSPLRAPVLEAQAKAALGPFVLEGVVAAAPGMPIVIRDSRPPACRSLGKFGGLLQALRISLLAQEMLPEGRGKDLELGGPKHFKTIISRSVGRWLLPFV